MKRYEVRWARLEPVEGAEMGKTRPVVIVSRDEFNERLRTVTVCPLTSQLHPQWQTRLQVTCDGQPAEIAVDHIRSLSKQRVGPLLGPLSAEDAAALRHLIALMYGEP